MSARPWNGGGASASPHLDPLDALPAFLAALPSLPRPVLSRLVARAIDLLDEMEPDPEMEDDDQDTGAEDDPRGFDPETDMCMAGDDCIAVAPTPYWQVRTSDLENGDAAQCVSYGMNQDAPIGQDNPVTL